MGGVRWLIPALDRIARREKYERLCGRGHRMDMHSGGR